MPDFDTTATEPLFPNTAEHSTLHFIATNWHRILTRNNNQETFYHYHRLLKQSLQKGGVAVRHNFRKGSWVTLLIDANAIPAGCYRFLEIRDQIILLTVGPEIVLGLNHAYWGEWLASASMTATPPTRIDNFLKQYEYNLQMLRHQDYILSPENFTFCLMSHRYAEKIYPRSVMSDFHFSHAA